MKTTNIINQKQRKIIIKNIKIQVKNYFLKIFNNKFMVFNKFFVKKIFASQKKTLVSHTIYHLFCCLNKF